MEFILYWAQNVGIVGLILISLIESVFSPILPDLVLIPLALAKPENAIYYAVIATMASVFGGILGYGIGNKIGTSAIHRFVPARYYKAMQDLFATYGGWAVFIGAISPIPYKFISITAGTFRVNMAVFFGASLLGRAKRFLLEGFIIFHYGPQALGIIQRYDDYIFLVPVIVVLIAGLIKYSIKYAKARRVSTE
jgi:undecaprenyl-diphosphatase